MKHSHIDNDNPDTNDIQFQRQSHLYYNVSIGNVIGIWECQLGDKLKTMFKLKLQSRSGDNLCQKLVKMYRNQAVFDR